jgi:hypothetical protein
VTSRALEASTLLAASEPLDEEQLPEHASAGGELSC